MKDHILHLPKYFASCDCKEVIDFFDKMKDFQREGSAGVDPKTGQSWVDLSIKKCSQITLDLNNRDEYPNICYSIVRTLDSGLDIYRKEYPFLNDLHQWDIYPYFNIQKYDTGDAYYQMHCENNGETILHTSRMAAWMIYLNDVTDDGETVFPSQKKKFKPCAGDLLLWPAYWTHPHKGIPSPTQTKYIATGWINFNEIDEKIERTLYSEYQSMN